MLTYMADFTLAAAATLGFGLLFNVPPRTLVGCCITGGVGHTVQLAATQLGASSAGASYVGALVVAVMGYILARVYRTPRMIFTVTGIIPMIPGVPAFSTMLAFASGNIDQGLLNAVQTLLIGGALAAGLTTVRVLTRVPGRSPDPV